MPSRAGGAEIPLEDLIYFGVINPSAFLADARVRLLLATSPGWLLRLPANTLQAVIRCKECPINLLQRLPRDRGMPLSARMAAASRPDMPPKALRLFMRHAALVRRELASNPSLPQDLEEPLSKDRSSFVRAAIAARTTNQEILRRLSRDRSLHRVRVAVATNAAIPDDARQYLSRSTILEIQKALIQHQPGGLCG
jgi:hypothetical protein